MVSSTKLTVQTGGTVLVNDFEERRGLSELVSATVLDMPQHLLAAEDLLGHLVGEGPAGGTRPEELDQR
jgi:hypothetical protein